MDPLAGLLGTSVQSITEGEVVRLAGAAAPLRWVDDEGYAEFRDLGVSLVTDAGGVVTQIQYFGPGCQGYAGYAGDLPGGISFADDRGRVRAKLGEPASSGGGVSVPVLGTAPAWDRFHLSGRAIFVRYGDGGQVALVGLSLDGPM